MSATPFSFDLKLLKEETCSLTLNPFYKSDDNQICLTGISPTDSFLTGSGSLYYKYFTPEGAQRTRVKRDNPPKDTDFKFFLDEFSKTYFYFVYQKISEKYKIGRMRLATLETKTCYTFHTDSFPRLHLAILSDANACGLIHDERVFRVPIDGKAYLVDTTLEHTAFNTSYDLSRTHLILDVLGEND